MKIEAFCEQYDVALELVDQFIEAGVLKNGKVMITDKEAEERLASCVCLYELGLDIDTIKAYTALAQSDENTCEERIAILQKYRDLNLQNIHKRKYLLDCIDDILQASKQYIK